MPPRCDMHRIIPAHPLFPGTRSRLCEKSGLRTRFVAWTPSQAWFLSRRCAWASRRYTPFSIVFCCFANTAYGSGVDARQSDGICTELTFRQVSSERIAKSAVTRRFRFREDKGRLQKEAIVMDFGIRCTTSVQTP